MWYFPRAKVTDSEAESDTSSSSDLDPRRTVEDRVFDLQQSVGNRAVQRMISDSGSPETESLPVHQGNSAGEKLEESTQQVMESGSERPLTMSAFTPTKTQRNPQHHLALTLTPPDVISISPAESTPRGVPRVSGSPLTNLLIRFSRAKGRRRAKPLLQVIARPPVRLPPIRWSERPTA